MTVYQQMEALVHGAAATYDEVYDDLEILSGMGFAIALNGLKVSTSTLVVDIVGTASRSAGSPATGRTRPTAWGGSCVDAYGPPSW